MARTPAPSSPSGTPFTPEILVGIREAQDPRLSPDGEEVLFTVARTGDDADPPARLTTDVWRVPAAGGEPVRAGLPTTDGRAARWSPDGSRYAWIGRSGPDGVAQVYVAPSGGADGVPVTEGQTDVTAFAWSPDGDRIAFIAADPEPAPAAPGRDWRVFDGTFRHLRLRIVPSGGGPEAVVTTGDLSVHELAWSPDGTRLAVACATEPNVDAFVLRPWVAIVDAAPGSVPVRLADTVGPLHHVRWSPDGRWIAWVGSVSAHDTPGASLFAAPAEGGGPARDLTEGYEGSVLGIEWIPSEPATLAVSAVEGTAYRLRSAALPDGALRSLAAEDGLALRSPSITVGRAVAVGSRPSHPPDLYRLATGPGGAPVRLTRLNPQLDRVAIAPQEIVRWQGRDGLEIEGVLVKPADFEPGRRYPTVVFVHGGPEDTRGDEWLGAFWTGWGQLLAPHGIATLIPNYRGSTGRGAAFGMASLGDMGGGEYTDCAAGLDALVARGIADPARLGITGDSWGGYMTAWGATADSARYRAAVMSCGISDWVSHCGTSNTAFHEQIAHFGVSLYDSPALYLERSPIAHVAKAQTPTLILHGADDMDAPTPQAYELYAALRSRGVPVEMVIYPHEAHEDVVEREHRIDYLGRIVDWFVRELGSEAAHA